MKPLFREDTRPFLGSRGGFQGAHGGAEKPLSRVGWEDPPKQSQDATFSRALRDRAGSGGHVQRARGCSWMEAHIQEDRHCVTSRVPSSGVS